MGLTDIEFSSQGKPCTGLRIRSIEKKIGRKLPEDYREFIKQTGGGRLSLKNMVLEGLTLDDGSELEVSVSNIFGNGHSPEDSNDLAEYGSFLAEEWEIPEEVLLIGSAESGMHECFVLNYDLEEFPQYSVLYLDNDNPDDFVLVAATFADFLGCLKPSPGYEDGVSGESGGKGLYAARHAPLSEGLIRAIDASPYGDMESVIRKAVEKIVDDQRIAMNGGEDSYRVQDLFFALSDPFGNHYSAESWKSFSETGRPVMNIRDFVDESFVDDQGFSKLIYNFRAIDMWWENRIASGVLVSTPQGYKLKDDYVRWLISTFR